MASTSSSNGSSASAAAAKQAAMFAARTKVNQQQMRYFAAGICSLIAVFVLAHWLRITLNNLSPSSRNPIRSTSRFVRNLLVRKFPGFPSSGHALVVAAYLAINLGLTFTNMKISATSLANRCGWMVVANLCVIVFLALKNTPLAVLTAYSYERLNCLHQVSGYTTFVYLILHASMYTNYFLSKGPADIFEEPSVQAGIVAGFAFLGLFFSGAIIRRWWYELFIAIHVSCFLIGLIAAANHQPDLTENGLLVMLVVTAAMWTTDRLMRGARMLVNSVNNYATIEALPHGGTKIVLAKWPLGGAVAGKHCYVWIPAIRKFESHPFTIAATEPIQFVVNAYDGFTRDLHKHAILNPGARLRVSMDGPYGTIPDPLKYDKVVLIAGGSGATFTFGLASNMLERMGPEAKNDIVFIWSVKKHANLSWFADHLQTLKNHPHSPKVTTSLYISDTTSAAPTADSASDDDRRCQTLAAFERDEEKGDLRAAITTTSDSDPEKSPARHHQAASTKSDTSSAPHHGHAVRSGRPNIAALIREAVALTPATGRVLVAACGPDGLLRTVRDVTASLIRGDGPGLELHCEKFGW